MTESITLPAPRVLYLPLKGIWFEQIKSGVKLEEYRDRTPNWTRKLKDRAYDYIVLTLGYPKRDDYSKRLVLPWKGCVEKTILHPHFGDSQIDVFAIDVSGKPIAPSLLKL